MQQQWRNQFKTQISQTFTLCDNIHLSKQLKKNSSFFFSVEETYYVLPWGRKCIWTILFVAMAITSTFGNLIVIWIVMSQKRMRTVTNYFIGKWWGLVWVCFGLDLGRVGGGSDLGWILDWIGFGQGWGWVCNWKIDFNVDCHVPPKNENSDQLFHQ